MSEPLAPAQIEAMLQASPFISFLGLTVSSLDAANQEIVMRSPMRPEFEREPGTKQWHGGPIASIIDTVGDYALVMFVGRGLPTINFRVDYFRPAIDTALISTGRVRRLGRTVGVADVDVHDEKGALIAIGRATYAI
ncbi:Phenylacetic acid degradation-related protein [Rhodopseudomonas palustris HaA2]|uniref:Phenylacetic acid degradation-related protein n=1 Tax=Rhodopseudomonas palustris (strain HaA2) TaxID=316058 RepID=Q2J101_RHOP2|nr:PaaI family thioesterase [Rhodopseudomonas palustris]ABD05859.1 Phenylacetic acid degradation-related protein [Rhodopseudomonas palustris HaA2]